MGKSGWNAAKSEFDVPWMVDLLNVPDDAAWPRLMSPLHPRAAGSLGGQIEAWALVELGVRLRWWQRLALRRQYEVDDAGELLWPEVVESTPRRAGKSLKHKVESMWRLTHADHFGERQLIMLTGRDLPVCKEIHRQSWEYAGRHHWLIRRTNGQEEVETLDGSRWMVRSQQGVYGYDTTSARVDEAWDVAGYVVDDGLQPSMLERVQPQLLLTSTAHRKSTGLMPGRIDEAQAGRGRRPLLLLWGADRDTPVDDEREWRRVLPYWTEHRAGEMRRALDRAQSGESLDADEHDPVESFLAQYLNVWTPPAAREAREWRTFQPDVFRMAPRPDGPPLVGAVESWYSDGAVAAAAWRGPVVEVAEFPTAGQACAHLVALGVPRLHVGKSLTSQPELAGAQVVGETGTTAWAAKELLRLVSQHTDGASFRLVAPAGVLLEQAGAVTTTRTKAGPTFASPGRADALKAAVWAARAALLIPDVAAVY